MSQQTDQLFGRQLRKINGGSARSPLRSDAIDAAIGPVPFGVGIGMRGSRIMPVGNRNRTIGSHGHIGGSKPWVVGDDQFTPVCGLKRRAARLDFMPIKAMSQQVSGNISVAEPVGE